MVEMAQQCSAEVVEQVLREVARVLRAGGRLVIVWSNRSAWVHRAAAFGLRVLARFQSSVRFDPSYHIHHIYHAPSRMRAAADRAGLALVEWFSIFPPWGMRLRGVDGPLVAAHRLELRRRLPQALRALTAATWAEPRARRSPQDAGSAAAPPRWAPLALGVLGALLILLREANFGVGLTWDSGSYLSVARNLVAGNGLLEWNGTRYQGAAPLFPLLLAAARSLRYRRRRGGRLRQRRRVRVDGLRRHRVAATPRPARRCSPCGRAARARCHRRWPPRRLTRGTRSSSSCSSWSRSRCWTGF